MDIFIAGEGERKAAAHNASHVHGSCNTAKPTERESRHLLLVLLQIK